MNTTAMYRKGDHLESYLSGGRYTITQVRVRENGRLHSYYVTREFNGHTMGLQILASEMKYWAKVA